MDAIVGPAGSALATHLCLPRINWPFWPELEALVREEFLTKGSQIVPYSVCIVWKYMSAVCGKGLL